jgi:hypothetical protein
VPATTLLELPPEEQAHRQNKKHFCAGASAAHALRLCNILPPGRSRPHVHGAVMEFDPIPGRAYNASYQGSSHRIACCKERERTWLFLND